MEITEVLTGWHPTFATTINNLVLQWMLTLEALWTTTILLNNYMTAGGKYTHMKP